MAAPGAGNQVARRVIDDLVDFSGKTSVQGYMRFFKAQQLSEIRLFGEVFDTLIGLRDDRHVEETKLAGLNDLITQGEEEIEIKDAYCAAEYGICHAQFVAVYTYVTVAIYVKFPLGRLKAPKSSEVAESPRLEDKMKYVFGRSRGENESVAKLVRDLCFALRFSLSKKRRPVAELEALGEREGAAKPFE
ncbi:hypothetical protein Tco_0916685, partial [Tanacetum coccineum]